MRDNFARSLNFTLAYEGGYVNHPRDPGGATNLGITKRTLEGWRGHPVTIDDVKALTRGEAAMIYKRNYWDAVSADELPSGVDAFVWDYGVNSGPSRSVKALQKCLGVKVDGLIGPATKDAARKADPVQLVDALTKERQRFVRSLRTYRTFGKGWERRITALRSLAMKMTSPLNHATPEPVDFEPPQPKAEATDKSMAKSTTIWAQLLAMATTGGGAALTALTQIDWKVMAIVTFAAVAAFSIYTISERMRHAREEGV